MVVSTPGLGVACRPGFVNTAVTRTQESELMGAPDIDPEILRISAAASAHAYAQSIWHIDEEMKCANGIMEPLYDTLTPEGPYAYMVMPEVRADGSVNLPRLTRREEIVQAYNFIRGHSDLTEVIGLTEIRGTWYTFQDNISRVLIKANPEQPYSTQTLGLFPSSDGPGITGELIWIRYPVETLGRADEANTIPADQLAARERVYNNYEHYLDGARANDVDAVLDVLHPMVASTVRDYVEDTGSITDMEGTAAHRAYQEAFFDRYEVTSLEKLSQVTDDWYVFAELRWTVSARNGAGDFAFHTAEFWAPAKTGRFIARIGHGTGPAPL
jgi:hypothetical protein